MASRYFRAARRSGTLNAIEESDAMLSELLMAVADDPFALGLAIMAATFLLEDAATITVALLASRMAIDGKTALAAATVGTILGDFALYAAARWAGERPLVRRWTSRPAVERVLDWMRRHAIPLVVLARFTPGLRLPVYAGAGTVRVAAGPFALAVILSTLVWTPGLYWAATALDAADLGAARWLAPGLLLVLLLFVPRVTARMLARRAQ
jgi:membrane protein DedA with SNARE-associated domain